MPRSWQGFLEPRRLRAGSCFALGLLGLAISSCATPARVPRAPAVAGIAAGPPAGGGISGQWLFRAEVSSAEGAGSLRLVLRRYDAARFTLEAADALGQARWEIRSDRDEAVWIEPQGHRFCRLEARVALRTPQWVSTISVADIAGLLTGEWPPDGALSTPPDSTSPASSSAAGVAGVAASSAVSASRHFTGERAGNEWASWTLWEGAEPLVWFKRLGADSLLSVRQPAVQVRWRVTARGNLGESAFLLLPGDLSASAREIACPDNAIP